MDNSSKNSNSEINQQEDKDSDVCSKMIFITILLMYIGIGLIFFKQDIYSQKHYNNFYNTECKPIVDNQSNEDIIKKNDICTKMTNEAEEKHNRFIMFIIILPLFILGFITYYFKDKNKNKNKNKD